MNTELAQVKTHLDVIFPEARTIEIKRAGATEVETLQIYAMPLQKWKKGIWYISQIAPMLGFDLTGMADEAKKQAIGDAKATEQPDNPDIDTAVLFEALQGAGSDLILEFTAFAIDKMNEDGTPNVKFFDGMYEEIIDILAAVIELNINFFAQRLLPKVLANTQQVVATVQQIKQHVAK